MFLAIALPVSWGSSVKEFESDLKAWRRQQKSYYQQYGATTADPASTAAPSTSPPSAANNDSPSDAAVPNGEVNEVVYDPDTVVSFAAACTGDSIKFCKSPNPFASDLCLTMHSSKLSPRCHEYQLAKMNCFSDLRSMGLCHGPASVRCLRGILKSESRSKLSPVCRLTRYALYLQKTA